ncbi:MAG: hypothetical protein LBI67_06370 [Treponema sp.]|jgi:hypothetical protein|nr:hypothetical protein [Treponema sp.]
MKKYFAFAAIIAGILFLSCSSMDFVIDEDVPVEKTARVVFYYFEPTSYNGILADKGKLRLVRVPAGTYAFDGDVNWYFSNGRMSWSFQHEDAAVSCTFEAGREYWVIADFEYNEAGDARLWGVSVYEEKIGVRVGFPSGDKRIAFIPFTPGVTSN